MGAKRAQAPALRAEDLGSASVPLVKVRTSLVLAPCRRDLASPPCRTFRRYRRRLGTGAKAVLLGCKGAGQCNTPPVAADGQRGSRSNPRRRSHGLPGSRRARSIACAAGRIPHPDPVRNAHASLAVSWPLRRGEKRLDPAGPSRWQTPYSVPRRVRLQRNACGGRLHRRESVVEPLKHLARRLACVVLTTDTYGTAERAASELGLALFRVADGLEKARLLTELRQGAGSRTGIVAVVSVNSSTPGSGPQGHGMIPPRGFLGRQHRRGGDRHRGPTASSRPIVFRGPSGGAHRTKGAARQARPCPPAPASAAG